MWLGKYNAKDKKNFLVQKLIVILLSLLLCTALLEIGIRIGGFIFLSLQEYRNKLSLMQKDSYRILCLGDSMTAEQYPRFLKQALSKKIKGINFMIIDKAKPCTNSDFVVSTLKENLDKYNPNIVVVMMGFNDDGDVLPYGNIHVSEEVPFKIYKLVRILWYHITNKIREINISKIEKEIRNINDIKETLTSESDTKEYYKKEEMFKKVMEINPQNDMTYVKLGWCYKTQNKYDKAVQMFKKAIEINPRNDRAHIELGWFYMYQGEYAKGEIILKQAIKLNPKNYLAYLNLGWNYNMQHKYDKAAEMFRQAIKINPKDVRAYLELGGYYIKYDGSYNKALTMFKKAIEINPENDKVYGGLAICYKELGRYKLAEEYFEKTDRLREKYYNSMVCQNYQKLKEIVTRKGIKLVCMQYPMLNIELLKGMFTDTEGVIFVDNETIFKKALSQGSYDEYFDDMYAGNFGHCTDKGNRLLAENIADIILKRIFNKR